MTSSINYINNIDSKRVNKNTNIQFRSTIKGAQRRNCNTNIIMKIEQVVKNDK